MAARNRHAGISKWASAGLGVLMLIVLVFGIGDTAIKAFEMAPWAESGEEGRLLFHTKNSSRFPGDAGDVRRAVWKAVYLSDERPPSPQDRQEELSSFIEANATEEPDHLVVLSDAGEEAAVWSLPGAYWAAYAGVPVVFAGGGTIGAEARAVLEEFATLPVYVMVPDQLAGDQVLDEIRETRQAEDPPVVRVAGGDPAAHAVRIATFRDEDRGVGWGRTADMEDGYFEYVIAAPGDAGAAYAALPLARSNAAAFLFAADDGGVPGATDSYLWGQRAEWFVTPAEGPFRHLWFVGDTVSYAGQARMELSLEKSPYASKGAPALGALEALAIVFIAFGVAGALIVLAHSLRLLPEQSMHMRVAWSFTAFLLPVLGLWLYLQAYRRPREDEAGLGRWMRPPIIQSASATAMGFGFGAPLMIIIGWFFLYFGFPLFFGEWADGWWFLLGAGMPLMMAGMYVLAVLLAGPLVQVPMRAMMEGRSYGASLAAGLGVTAVSMAAVSLGMMSVAWLMLMFKIPMMPKEDEILFFGALWLASAVGFLVAWPLNWVMIRAGLKMGSM